MVPGGFTPYSSHYFAVNVSFHLHVFVPDPFSLSLPNGHSLTNTVLVLNVSLAFNNFLLFSLS